MILFFYYNIYVTFISVTIQCHSYPCQGGIIFMTGCLLARLRKYYWLEPCEKIMGLLGPILIPLNSESDLYPHVDTKIIRIFPIYLLLCALAEVCVDTNAFLMKW